MTTGPMPIMDLLMPGMRPGPSALSGRSTPNLPGFAPPIYYKGQLWRAGRFAGVDPSKVHLFDSGDGIGFIAEAGVFRPVGVPNPFAMDDAGVPYPSNTFVLICGGYGGLPTDDLNTFLRQFPIVPGTPVAPWSTPREDDDLLQGWDSYGGVFLSYLNYRFCSPAFVAPVPVICSPGIPSYPANIHGGQQPWSQVPDLACYPLWQGMAVLNYYQFLMGPAGTAVSTGSGGSGVLTSTITTATVLVQKDGVTVYSNTLGAGTYTFDIGTLDIDPTKVLINAGLFATITTPSGPSTILLGSISNFVGYRKAVLTVTVNVAAQPMPSTNYNVSVSGTIVGSPALVPPPFSWPDTAGGYHIGAIDPARVRAPTITGNEPAPPVQVPTGTLTYTAGTLEQILVFRPTGGSQLLKNSGSTPMRALIAGEYPMNWSNGFARLSHGDGRPFFVAGAQGTTVTLAPITIVPTTIPPLGIVTTQAMAADYPTQTKYIFLKFIAPADGTYRISISGLGTLAGGVDWYLGMAADLAVSISDPLALDATPVRIVHDYVDSNMSLTTSPNVGGPAAGWIKGRVVGGIQQWYPPWIVPGMRYGTWLWDGNSWSDGSLKVLSTTIKATLGQTVYVRVTGQVSEFSLSTAPLGVTVSWQAM